MARSQQTATALAAALEPIQKDIQDLRRAQYEQQGQGIQRAETNADPVLIEIRRLAALQENQAGAREADCAWTPDGMLVMAEKDVLYGWRRGDASTLREPQGRPEQGRGATGSGQAAWQKLADLAALGLHGVTRIAISPKGDRIAFVTQP